MNRSHETDADIVGAAENTDQCFDDAAWRCDHDTDLTCGDNILESKSTTTNTPSLLQDDVF